MPVGTYINILRSSTYIPTYLHTYIPTYLHTYIHTYIHTYMHACMHVRVCACVRACARARACVCMVNVDVQYYKQTITINLPLKPVSRLNQHEIQLTATTVIRTTTAITTISRLFTISELLCPCDYLTKTILNNWVGLPGSWIIRVGLCFCRSSCDPEPWRVTLIPTSVAPGNGKFDPKHNIHSDTFLRIKHVFFYRVNKVVTQSYVLLYTAKPALVLTCPQRQPLYNGTCIVKLPNDFLSQSWNSP